MREASANASQSIPIATQSTTKTTQKKEKDREEQLLRSHDTTLVPLKSAISPMAQKDH